MPDVQSSLAMTGFAIRSGLLTHSSISEPNKEEDIPIVAKLRLLVKRGSGDDFVQFFISPTLYQGVRRGDGTNPSIDCRPGQ